MKKEHKSIDKLASYTFFNIHKDEKIQPYNVDQSRRFFKAQSQKDNVNSPIMPSSAGSSLALTSTLSKLNPDSDYKDKRPKPPMKMQEYIQYSDSELHDEPNNNNTNNNTENKVSTTAYEKIVNLPYISPKDISIKMNKIIDKKFNNSQDSHDNGNSNNNANNTCTRTINKCKSPNHTHHTIYTNHNNNNELLLLSSFNNANSNNKMNADYSYRSIYNKLSSEDKDINKDKKDDLISIIDKIKELQNINNLDKSLLLKNIELSQNLSPELIKKNKDNKYFFKNDVACLLDLKNRKKLITNENNDIGIINNVKNNNNNESNKDNLSAKEVKDSKEIVPGISQKVTINQSDILQEKVRSLFKNPIKSTKFFTPNISPTRRNEFHSQIIEEIRNAQIPSSKAISRSTINTRSNSPEFRSSNFNKLRYSKYMSLSSCNFNNNSYIQSLRREIPCIFTNKPSGRQEVLNLGVWLSKTLKDIDDNSNLSKYEKLIYADDIYNICLNELIRQVSYECFERGELIMKIWKAYINLTEEMMEEYKNQEKIIENKCDGEYNLQHNTYEILLKKKDEKYINLFNEMDKFQIDYKFMKEQYNNLIQNEVEYKSEIMRLKNFLIALKKNFQGLKNENENLRYKYEKVKEEANSKEDEEIDENMYARQRTKTTDEEEYNEFDQDKHPHESLGLKKRQIPQLEENSTQTEKPQGLNIEIQANPIELRDKDTQTILELKDNRYDRILCDMRKVNDLLTEEALKLKIVHDVEMMENLNEEVPVEYADNVEFQQNFKFRKNHHIKKKPLIMSNLNDSEWSGDDDEVVHRLFQDTHTKYQEEKARIGSEYHNETKQKSRDNNKKNNDTIDNNAKSHDFIEDNKDYIHADDKFESNQEKDIIESNEMDQNEEIIDTKIEKIDEVDDDDQIVSLRAIENTDRNYKILDENPNTNNSVEIACINNEETPVIQREYIHSKTVNIQQVAKPYNEKVSMSQSTNIQASLTIPTVQHTPKKQFLIDQSPIIPKQPKALPARTYNKSNTTIIHTKKPSPNDIPKLNSSNMPSKTNQTNQQQQQPSHPQQQSQQPQQHSQSHSQHHSQFQSHQRSQSNKFNSKSKSLDKSPEKSLVSNLNNDNKNIITNIIKKDNELKSKQENNNNSLHRPNSIAILERAMKSFTDDTDGESSPIKISKHRRIEKIDEASLIKEEPEEKLITMMNLYKVEKEKYENISNVNQELELQLTEDDHLIQNLKEMIQKLQKELHFSLDKITELEELNKLLETHNKNLQKVKNLKMKNVDFYQRRYSKTKSISDDEDENNSSKALSDTNDDKDIFYKRLEGKGPSKNERMKYFVNHVIKKINKLKKSTAAINLLARIRKKSISKIRVIIPLKHVLKQITQFYNEKIVLSKENGLFKDQDMGIFIYKLFLHTYGFKKFAEKKLMKFYSSIKKYISISRIFRFARLCGICDPNLTYNTDEQQLYLNIYDYIQNCNLIIVNEKNEYNKKIYIPYNKCIEYLKSFLERKLTQDEFVDIRKELEKVKEIDASGTHKSGIIDTDVFVDKLLFKFKYILNRYKESLQSIILSISLDPKDSNRINYTEFYLLYKYIESDKYDPKKCQELYMNHVDIIETDNCWLSNDKFVYISYEYELFNPSKQNKFLASLISNSNINGSGSSSSNSGSNSNNMSSSIGNINNNSNNSNNNNNNTEDINKKFDDIKIKWLEQKEMINDILNQIKSDFDELLYKTLYNAYLTLSEYLLDNNNSNNSSIVQKKAIIIRYKILLLELKLIPNNP